MFAYEMKVSCVDSEDGCLKSTAGCRSNGNLGDVLANGIYS